MSIILDALNTKKEEDDKKQELEKQEEARPLEDKMEEGFFLGDNKVTQKASTSNSKRVFLLSILLVACVLMVSSMWYRKHENSQALLTSKPIPRTNFSKYPPNKKEKLSVIVSIEEARKLFQEGEYDKSIKLYQEHLKDNPGNPTAQNDLGLAFLKKELYSSAETHFSKALELDDHCAECFNNLGYLKTVLGENIEAKKYFKRALEIKADYPDPHFNLAVLLEKKGELRAAVDSFQTYLKLSADSDSTLNRKVLHHVRELTGQ